METIIYIAITSIIVLVVVYNWGYRDAKNRYQINKR